MARGIVAFLFVWGIIYFGLGIFYQLKNTEKLQLLKQVAYSLGAATIAFVVLSFIVLLF